MTGGSPSSPPGSGTKGVVARFLIWAIPVLLVGAILESFLSVEADRVKADFLARAEESLERVSAGSDGLDYLRREISRIRGELDRAGDAISPRFIQGLGKGLRRDLALDLLVFNARGELKGTFPKNPANLWFMRNLFLEILQSRGGKPVPGRNLTKLMTQMFGFGKTVRWLADSPGRLLPVTHQKRDAWVFWIRRPGYGLLAFCRQIPTPSSLMAMSAREAGSDRWPRGSFFGICSPLSEVWETARGKPPCPPREVWKEFSGSGGETGMKSGKYWVFRSTPSGMIAFAGFPVPPGLGQTKPWPFRIFLITMGSLIFLRFGWSDRHLGSIRRISIGLFLFAALVPLGGMVLGTQALLEERAEVMRNQVLRFETETLDGIDSRFSGFLFRFEKRISGITGSKKFFSELSAAIGTVQALMKKGLGTRSELRDRMGELLFTTDKEGGGLKTMMPTLARLAISRWIPDFYRPPEKDAQKMADELFSDPEMGLDVMAHAPRTLLHLNTSGIPFFIFWDVARPPVSDFAFASLLFLKESLIRSYLRRELLNRWDLFETQIRIAAFNLERSEWIPGDFPHRSELLPVVRTAGFLQRTRSGSTWLGSEKFWYSVLPPRQLDNFCLVAYFPEAGLTKRLDGLKMNIVWGLLIALFVAVALGNLISSRLLSPVSNIGTGVEELRQRSFKSPIPIMGNDELGDLSRTFNEMALELRELDVARAVQERLIPKDFPRLPEFEIHGLVAFAGDLGGDCLECRQLPDGRVLVFIGDISGHGVGSALLMAFIKGAITLWTEGGKHDPAVLARAVDSMLSSLGGKRKFLAMFCGILDPAGNKLSFLSGGHPYPLLRFRNGDVKELGGPAYPLGSRRKPQPFPTGEVSMEKGDTILCYTDGLVEATDGLGAPFGYSGLSSWVAEHRVVGSVEDYLQSLRKFVRDRSERLEDDVTLLAIHRRQKA